MARANPVRDRSPDNLAEALAKRTPEQMADVVVRTFASLSEADRRAFWSCVASHPDQSLYDVSRRTWMAALNSLLPLHQEAARRRGHGAQVRAQRTERRHQLIDGYLSASNVVAGNADWSKVREFLLVTDPDCMRGKGKEPMSATSIKDRYIRARRRPSGPSTPTASLSNCN
jgi:hypothetical protein